jgi:RHS repeat-associated protein
VKVTDKNSQGTVTQVVEYIYDVFNRRIGRKLDTTSPFDMANAVIERYVLDDIHNGLSSADGGNVVLDFVDPDGSGAQAIAMSKRYLYGEAVDQIFAQEDLAKTLGDAARNLWPLVDHLGTVRDLAKQDGTIAVHYKYDSFGNVTSGDTSKTRYLFTSREFDAPTKLQYNRARYYDAAVGRWISEDPLGFAAGDANLGRYVGNEATGPTDPSGLTPPLGYWEGVGSVFKGYWGAAKGTVAGVIHVGLHPIQTAQGVGHAVLHPIDTAILIKDDIVEKSGSLEGQGELVGEVLIGVATGGAIKAIKESGTVGKIVTKIDRLVPGERPHHVPEIPGCFVAGTLVAVAPDTTAVSDVVGASRGDGRLNWLLTSVLLVGAIGIQCEQVLRRRRRKSIDDHYTTIFDPVVGDFEPSNGVACPQCRTSNAFIGMSLTNTRTDLQTTCWREETTESPSEYGLGTDTCVSPTLADRYFQHVGDVSGALVGIKSGTMQQRRARRPRWLIAPWPVCLLMLAGLSWLIGMTNDSQSVTNSLSVTQHSSATLPVQFVPIEELRVGDRVMADNPDNSQVEPATDTQVDPRTWRHIVMEADLRWDDGTPDPIRLETLQPPDWIAMQGAEVGQLVDLPLDLVEMGLPADLRARVLETRPCPTLVPGPGRIVLTTVNHLHNRVVELQVRDANGRPETLRPTCFHKFYSQTRRAWISAQDLQVDEVLAGLRGPVTVASTVALPGIHRVYNLTVEGEHVYHVSKQHVAAHNNECSPPKRTPARGKPNSLEAFDDGRGGGTIRDFGPDGQARIDYDFGHDHGAGDPHAHDWDWSMPKPRGAGRPLRPGE